VSRGGQWLLALGMTMVAAAGCGKRGDPLPPLRPVPARITDLRAERATDRIDVRWTIPAENEDGTTPPAVDRVDLFGVTLPSDAPAPPAGVIAGDPTNLILRLIVDRTSPAASPPPDGEVRPRPGDAARFTDRAPVDTTAAPETRHYVAVPAAGTSGGRPGGVSSVVSVPMGALPAPPAGVSLTHDETAIQLSWQPAEEGLTYRVYRPGTSADSAAALLTPEPLTATAFSTPVEFAGERCFTIEPLRMHERVTLVGPTSPPQCITATDTYPPPAPAGLQVVQEGTAVTLIWTPVTAPDLAGYVVLRGDRDAASLAPIVAAPIAETTFRDGNVQPGQSYVYAVYAVDSSPAANASPPSARQAITVR
jgi:hypothetical protein